jgi:hypothetical protein
MARNSTFMHSSLTALWAWKSPQSNGKRGEQRICYMTKVVYCWFFVQLLLFILLNVDIMTKTRYISLFQTGWRLVFDQNLVTENLSWSDQRCDGNIRNSACKSSWPTVGDFVATFKRNVKINFKNRYVWYSMRG